MIIKKSSTFSEQYDKLTKDDIILGRIRLRTGEEHLLLDLVARSIPLIPSARSQLLSRSKVFQARLLGGFMVPGTMTIYTIHDIMKAVAKYGTQYPGRVVCKLDRANGGRGILLFSSVEDVYTQAALQTLSYPFVIQPFVEEGVDVRVILLGDYIESYRRYNSGNFRHNLHCGGTSSEHILTSSQKKVCERVMKRADFAYGHVDLLLAKNGASYLSEINLRGGLRGAQISPQEYKDRVDRICQEQLDAIISS